jgi:hypothetical protein
MSYVADERLPSSSSPPPAHSDDSTLYKLAAGHQGSSICDEITLSKDIAAAKTITLA